MQLLLPNGAHPLSRHPVFFFCNRRTAKDFLLQHAKDAREISLGLFLKSQPHAVVTLHS